MSDSEEKPIDVAQLEFLKQLSRTGAIRESPEQVQNDMARQGGAALAVCILGLLLGLGIAVAWREVTGVLVAILGLLLGGFLKLDAFLACITTNQCTIIDLQKEMIRELRNVSSSIREIGR